MSPKTRIPLLPLLRLFATKVDHKAIVRWIFGIPSGKYNSSVVLIIISPLDSSYVSEEFEVLLTLIRCDTFFPGSTCLYRDMRFSMGFTQMARAEKHWCIVRFSITKESFLIFK